MKNIKKLESYVHKYFTINNICFVLERSKTKYSFSLLPPANMKFISYTASLALSKIMLGNFVGNYVHVFRKSFANIRDPVPGCHGIGVAAAGILWALYPPSILEFRLVYLHDLLPGATINWRFSRNKDLIPFQKLMYAQLNPIASDASFFFNFSAHLYRIMRKHGRLPALFFAVSRKMTEH